MKFGRKAFLVALDLLPKRNGSNVVELREVAVQHHPVTADQEDTVLDALLGDKRVSSVMGKEYHEGRREVEREAG